MKTKTLIMWVAGLCIACFALTFFVTLPLKNNLSVTKDEITKEEILLAQRKKQKADLVALTKQYEEIKNNVSQLETGFISKDTKSFLTFIETIENLAKQQNLTHEISIPNIPKPDDVKTLQSEIIISTTGSYQSTYAFMALLEKQPAYISLSSVTITETAAEPNLSYRAEMRGNVFWK